MRKALIAILLPAMLALAYVAWPFWSAYQLRQAVKFGDLAAMKRKIEWPTVRASLRASLLERLRDAPSSIAPQGPGEQNRKSWTNMWLNVKAAITISVVDNTVERMLTPKGLARLFAVRENYHQKVAPSLGIGRPSGPFDGTWLEGSWIERSAKAIKRMKSIRFANPTRVEIEIADRYTPSRHYNIVLQLKEYNWKLVALRLAPRLRSTSGHE